MEAGTLPFRRSAGPISHLEASQDASSGQMSDRIDVAAPLRSYVWRVDRALKSGTCIILRNLPGVRIFVEA